MSHQVFKYGFAPTRIDSGYGKRGKSSSARSRRSPLEIMVEIIRISRDNGGVRKTRIVYGANLNYNIAGEYLERMIGNGFIVYEKPLYYQTEKGEEFINMYEALRQMEAGG